MTFTGTFMRRWGARSIGQTGRLIRLGQFTTHGLRKFLIAKELAMSQWNLGSFSNLGDWDSEKEITQRRLPGKLAVLPAGVALPTDWRGLHDVSKPVEPVIQAHPELTTDPAVPKAWMQNWVKEIELDLASGLADPAISFWRRELRPKI